jgi:hypothetical protein
MTRRRINADNEHLIGKHYRLPGSIVPCVVADIDPEREGILLALNTHSFRHFEVEAAAVRAAIFAAERRAERKKDAA